MVGEGVVRYNDPITTPFWEGVSRRELQIQKCLACGVYQFYPRPFCLSCFSDRIDWLKASGKATIYSTTTVHIELSPEFKPPYVVAIVELAEGPRMLTNLVGRAGKIGDRVRVSWLERSGRVWLPAFELDDEVKGLKGA